MGKALIFDGITVSNPLRVITFAPDTAEGWVNNYASVVTIDSTTKAALVTFVQTLMNAGLWDSVRDFFPMLGGLDGYAVSLKRPTKDFNWNLPTGTTWDSNRNAPYLELAGLAAGKSLDYTDEDEYFDNQNSTFIVSFKTKRKMEATLVCTNKYEYNGYDSTCIVKDTYHWTLLGWSPITYNGGSSHFPGYNGAANSNNVLCVTFGENSRDGYLNFNNTILNFTTKEAGDAGSKPGKFAFGGYYAASATAPANNTLNGILNSFICMDSFVTQAQATTILNAIYALDETLGRHTNFS